MVKPKGLGRGLDALLGDEEPRESDGEALRNLAIESLQPGKYQPRSHMAQDTLAELAESIKSQGVMQPILVRPLGAGRYEIIAGERRWRAARQRRSPAMISKRSPGSGRASMGCITPCALIDAASSARASSPMCERVWYFPG